jgi:hypothetical protein
MGNLVLKGGASHAQENAFHSYISALSAIVANNSSGFSRPLASQAVSQQHL